MFAKYLSVEPQTYQQVRWVAGKRVRSRSRQCSLRLQLSLKRFGVANVVGSSVGTVVDMKEVNGNWTYSIRLKDGVSTPFSLQ